VTKLKRTAASILAVACAAGLAGAAIAQSRFGEGYEPPRTADGRPDLQGIWSTASVTPLERPEGYPLVLTRAQADELEAGALYNRRVATESAPIPPSEGAPEAGAALPPVGNYSYVWTDPGSKVATIAGEMRSSWIVYPEDGRIPALTEEGEALRAAHPRRRGSGYDNPEERGLGERCVLLTGGPPLRSSLYNNNVQIVQTPEDVMFMVEMAHDVRIARIGDAHRGDGVETWMGDAVARWDGDTLVVETTNIHPDQRADRTFLSADGKITERFTRISDDQILYQYEVDDPTVYTDVWRAETALNRLDEQIYEYACHEGNYGLYGILAGGRRNDAAGVAQTGGDQREE
jgi:hypothetical protein